MCSKKTNQSIRTMVVVLWTRRTKDRLRSARERLQLLQQDTQVVEIKVRKQRDHKSLEEKLYEIAVSMSQTNKSGKGWRNKVT